MVIGRLPRVIRGIEAETPTIRDAFSKMQEALANSAKESSTKINDLLQKALETEKKTSIAARMAMLATTTALLLICIFAIQVILGL